MDRRCPCLGLCPGNPGANPNFATHPDADVNADSDTDPHANSDPHANANVNAGPHTDSDANSFLGSAALHARGTGDRLKSVARHVRLH
jgi:hypothetical protein